MTFIVTSIYVTSICDLQETDNVYAIETPSPVVETPGGQQQQQENGGATYTPPSYITAVVLNRTGAGSQGRR